MELARPWLLLLALPVLIHLVQRQLASGIKFPSLMFLRQIPWREKRRLEDLTSKQNEELRTLNDSLEERVAERSDDLERAVGEPAQHFARADLEVGEVRRLGHAAQTNPRTRLVDHVNCLVRQMPLVDVPVSQFSRRADGIIGVTDLMVLLEATLQTAQYFNGLLDTRLIHVNFLEATSQRMVLLENAAIL